MPFRPRPGSALSERAQASGGAITLLPEDAENVDLQEFDAYISDVYAYLQVGIGSV